MSPFLLDTMPYVLTLVVLIVWGGRRRPAAPASLGRVYQGTEYDSVRYFEAKETETLVPPPALLPVRACPGITAERRPWRQGTRRTGDGSACGRAPVAATAQPPP